MPAQRVEVPRNIIEGFRKIECASIGDAVSGLGLRCIAQGIFPLARGMRVCGPAVTLRQISSRDNRNWARHEQALVEICRPGDVLVMDCGGRTDGAPWGGNVTREARTRGLDGTVIDGATRDSEEIIGFGYPLFCRSATLPHTHGLFLTTCMNNEPIQIGKFPHAVMVAPGDIVCGDADGIVIVPAERAAEILERAKRRHDDDQRMHALLESGKVHGDPEVNAQVAKSRALEGVEQAEGYKW